MSADDPDLPPTDTPPPLPGGSDNPYAVPATGAPAPAIPAGGAPRGLGPPWLRGLLATPFAIVVQVVIVSIGLAILFATTDSDTVQRLLDGSELLLSAGTYLLVCPVLWIAWKLFDQASLADMGHAGPWRRGCAETGLGFLYGLVLLSVILGLGAGVGAWDVQAGDWRAGLAAQAIYLPALLAAAYFEELLLRGWVMQDLGRRRPWLGLLVSSLVFAVLHSANPNLLANGAAGMLLGFLNIFLAGLLLGSIFLLSGRLWLPTGLDLGWNWTTAVLFGLPVSGFRLPSLMRSEATEGSGLLSGGAFGPEGSILCLLVLGPVALALTWVALRRGCPVPIVARHAPAPGDRIEELGPQPDATA